MVKIDCIILLLIMGCGCNLSEKRPQIQDVQGKQILNSDNIWLSHEHILVDFIGRIVFSRIPGIMIQLSKK